MPQFVVITSKTVLPRKMSCPCAVTLSATQEQDCGISENFFYLTICVEANAIGSNYFGKNFLNQCLYTYCLCFRLGFMGAKYFTMNKINSTIDTTNCVFEENHIFSQNSHYLYYFQHLICKYTSYRVI